MSFGDTPTPPSPSDALAAGQQTAAQQWAANQTAGAASQAGSMVGQSNPWGGLSYSQTGVGPNGVPIYSSNVNLSPTQQNLYDLLSGTQSTAGGQAGSLLRNANYGGANPSDVIGNMTSGTTKDLLDKQVGFLQPFFGTSRDQLDTKLKNQGLAPGNPAYDNAMRGLDTSQGLTVNKLVGDSENTAFNQATQMYGLPAEMALSLAKFGSPTAPSWLQTPQAHYDPSNVTGATANASQMLNNQYQANLAQNQNMMSGLFGIAAPVLGSYAGSAGGSAAISSALGMLSDRRAKNVIGRVATLDNGLPLYLFTYKSGGPAQVGLMADEVEQVYPEAVHVADGLKYVDYNIAMH